MMRPLIVGRFSGGRGAIHSATFDGDGQITAAADAVLYNGDALGDRLGLGRGASEPQLIVAAYRRWGEDCVDHMEGDFAFAVADAARGKLFLARDRFGVRPLYYRRQGQCFEFASRVGQLAQSEGEAPARRPGAVAAFLLGRVLDHEGTFFEGIYRLPAAHCLRVTSEGVSMRRYWQPGPVPLPRRADLPELFRTTFEQSVRDRLRRTRSPGALLSGGLDSSSIACVARDCLAKGGKGKLPSFSLVFDASGTCNERPFIDAVTRGGGFAPTILDRQDYQPLGDLDAMFAEQDGPVLAPNLACMRPLLARARQSGVGVLLDGHGGDEVVSHGFGRLDDLAASGRWIRLWRECAALADTYGRPTWPTLAAICVRHSRMDARIAARVLRRFDSAAAGEPLHLLSRECITTSGIREEIRAAGVIDPSAGEQAQHIATLAAPLQPYAFEVLANAYAAHGVEGRFPFWDRRIVELCLSLPAREKLDHGWSRLILRRAMTGVIPEQVRLRRDKMDFVHLLASGLVRHHHEEISEVLSDGAGELASYVDLHRARGFYARLAADPCKAPGREVQALWRAVVMGRWLKQRPRTGAGFAPFYAATQWRQSDDGSANPRQCPARVEVSGPAGADLRLPCLRPRDPFGHRVAGAVAGELRAGGRAHSHRSHAQRLPAARSAGGVRFPR